MANFKTSLSAQETHRLPLSRANYSFYDQHDLTHKFGSEKFNISLTETPFSPGVYSISLRMDDMCGYISQSLFAVLYENRGADVLL